MVQKKTENTRSKVLKRRISRIEEGYAKITVRLFEGSTRLRFYRKLASLLRNRFSLMDALERMYQIYSDDGKSKGEPFAIAIACWSRSLSGGASFSEAIKGWAPSRECLMLSVGDISHLDKALDNLVRVIEGISKMVAPVVSAISYPAFLIVLLFLIIYAIGAFMVPPMLEAAPDLRWTGNAKLMVDMSFWVDSNWYIMVIAFPLTALVIFLSLANWKGRSRVWFENVPPWSMYRIFTGVSWLLSFSALVSAGTPVSRALMQLRNDASPYLLERINKALIYVNNGENLGDALFKTKYQFPDKEIIGDLRIYAELDNFSAALTQLSNEWLENSEKVIADKAGILNMLAILAIAGTVAWSVFATFEMQDQLVRGMGI